MYPAPFAVRLFERSGDYPEAVDPANKSVQVFVLDGKYYVAEDFGTAEDKIKVTVLEDCTIDLSQIFSE